MNMDKINSSVTCLKQDIQSLIDNESLKHLSCRELDEIINIKHGLEKVSWQEKQQEQQDIKKRYLDLQPSDAERVKAIFYWQDCDIGSRLNFDDVKKVLVDIINNSQSHKDFDMFWDLIRNGKVKLSKQDVSDLNDTFINYVAKKDFYRNPSRNIIRYVQKHNMDKEEEWEDEEYDLESRKIKTYMTNKERFWIDVIASGKKIDNVLVCLALDCDQRLRYLPIGITKFEGDLIPQISEYYQTIVLSPVIKYRRNVGVVLNNSINEFYEFDKVFNKLENSVFCSHVTVEFPHMCYVYPSRLELYVQNIDNKGKFYVECGQEYILTSFQEKKQVYSANNEKHEVIKLNVKDIKPSTYVSIGHIPYNYFNIISVSIYGEAFVLV